MTISPSEFVGFYYNLDSVQEQSGALVCVRVNSPYIVWRCGSKDVRQGPKFAQIIKGPNGVLELLYYKRDPVEHPGNPDVSLMCQ